MQQQAACHLVQAASSSGHGRQQQDRPPTPAPPSAAHSAARAICAPAGQPTCVLCWPPPRLPLAGLAAASACHTALPWRSRCPPAGWLTSFLVVGRARALWASRWCSLIWHTCCSPHPPPARSPAHMLAESCTCQQRARICLWLAHHTAHQGGCHAATGRVRPQLALQQWAEAMLMLMTRCRSGAERARCLLDRCWTGAFAENLQACWAC